ncbi:lipocalin [Spongiimicrobium salis]|uniref:lipocalin n=1 Tax=Spongiimicrobium salis TaxID=1667022 RepID=UPI00374D0601
MQKIVKLLVISLLLVSCNASKTIIQSKRVMKGNWTLDNVTHNASGTYSIELLQDVSRDCFEGSTWQFIPNNNSGLYSINNGGCATGERPFIFTIQEINAQTGLYDFLLKPTTKLGKADKQKTSGFRLNLTALSDTAMQWQQTLQVDGKPFTITMNFSKTQ